MSNTDKILIVDNERRMCESIKLLFSGLNYELKTACSAAEAEALLGNEPFDLAILDMALPDNGTLKVFDHIKRRCPETLVIGITGQALFESEARTLKEGVYDVFKKPFEPDNLLTGVKNALSQKRLSIERRTAEKALRESELKFRTFFDLSPAAAAFAHRETEKIVEVNQKFLEVFKFSKEEVLGNSLAEAGICSREHCRRLMNAIQEAKGGRGLETELSAKDGSTLKGLVYAEPFETDDKNYFFSIFDVAPETKKNEPEREQPQAVETPATADDLIVLVEKKDPAEKAPGKKQKKPVEQPKKVEEKAPPLHADAGDVNLLLRQLEDKDEGVRRAAAKALGKRRDPRAVEALLELVGVEDYVGQIEEELDLNLDLKDFDLDFKFEKKEKGPDVGIRILAASALGEIGDARAVETLITAFHDNNEGVRLAAVAALGKIGDARAVEPLIFMLHDDCDDIRREAAHALGRIGDSRAVEPLIFSLDDFDENVQSAAAGALAEIGDAGAVGPLVELIRLNGNDKPAEEELDLDPDFADLDLVRKLGDSKEDREKKNKMILDTIVKIGKPAIEPLAKAVKSKDAGFRVLAKSIIDRIKSR